MFLSCRVTEIILTKKSTNYVEAKSSLNYFSLVDKIAVKNLESINEALTVSHLVSRL